MKRTLLVGLTLAATLGLSACGSSASSDTSTVDQSPVYGDSATCWHGAFTQTVPSGNSVQCIWVDNNQAGGLSCDWKSYNARQYPSGKTTFDDGATRWHGAYEQQVSTNRTVVCVWVDNNQAGGLSCNWDEQSTR